MPRRPSAPKAKNLFGEAAPEPKPAATYRANIDGGSRGNPGPAAYGVVIRDARGEIVARLKKYIGRSTNNVAEYYGLIAAMDYAQSHGVRAIRIESDSELLVKQMRGLYKVKSADLQPLFERAKKMSQSFESFRIDHVYREQNRDADTLANEALDETEARAWQKLLSVMTHEIMNSVAPISSLAETMLHRLNKTVELFHEKPAAMEDLELGIDTIRRRSEGLLKFAETYRNLNKITSPTLKKTYARDLFENLHQLMQPTLHQKNIELEIILKDPDLSMEVDPSLIEQVLINLVVNAMEAVKEREHPRIVLSAAQSANNKIGIKVMDNGIGIAPELLDKIFIPFFSTRKNGSGIGLSLCKQIVMLHKGTIQVQSVEGGGTAFLLNI